MSRQPATAAASPPRCAAPLEGAEHLARGLVDLTGRPADVTMLERTVNGRPGLVAQQDGVIVTVYAFDIAGDRITHIWAVRNPEKLRPWTVGHSTETKPARPHPWPDPRNLEPIRPRRPQTVKRLGVHGGHHAAEHRHRVTMDQRPWRRRDF
ncbi:hypothetical protein [Streptomyces sp. NPDC060035]|uniref:hypothetical protein n=1 Tax=Streptomyces sp. NPDC060035 TaxID=3347044 RepID=UPI0036B6B9D0